MKRVGGARAWIVWGVGVLAYAAAVLQRTTFGVAGLEAAHHFDATASIVSLFVVLQLVVYAGMQIPVGLLLDRFGPRAMVTCGALLMLLGQVTMAFAETVAGGVLARVLVGAGDAMTFASVVRLVPSWFPPSRVAVLTQFQGLLGQSGQILSAVPFAALLAGAGWRTAFLTAAAVAGLVVVTTLLGMRDRPAGEQPPRPPTGTRDPIPAQIGAVWGHPATRLGLWIHFTTSFSAMAFAMMWGFPYLVRGQDLSRPAASAMLTVFVVAGIVFSPTIGVLTQRYPLRRTNLAFAVVGLNLAPWLAVLAWPGTAPAWLLVVLMVGLASGGPGSVIAFDFARSFLPPHRLGTATGIIIMGGFGGALVTILLTGLVLDLTARAGLADPGAFRLAMSIQLVGFAIGIVGVARARRTVRARMADEGVRPDRLGAALRRRWRRR